MNTASVSEAVAEGFAKHRSFDSCYCDAADADVLMHHLARLEQAYLSRLPPALRADSSLSFGLAQGRGVALERIANLFDSKWRKQCLPPDSAKAIFRALAGPNPQGMCWKGWRLSGFGETQVSGARPTIVHAEKIVAAFQRMWACPVVVEALPLTILKPPGGSMLAAHIDSGSMLEAYVACRELLAAGRASPLDWAREHGCQALIHWEGARPNRAAAKDGTREIIFRSQHTSFNLTPVVPDVLMPRMTPSQSPHRCPHVRPFAPDYRTLLCLPLHVPPRAHARGHPTAQDGRRACGKCSREIDRSARAAVGDGGRAHLADDVSSLACHPYAPMLPRLFASPRLASPLDFSSPCLHCLLRISLFALSAHPGASGMRRWPGSWPRAARCSRPFSKRPCSPH